MTTLELAKYQDAESLKAISIAAFTSDYQLYGSYPPGIESLAWHQAEIEKGHYFKIQYSGELAGGICVIPSETNKIEIKFFFISDDFQNRKIGTTVMELIENKYSSATTWTLVTPYKAFRNHHFYEKLGYLKVNEIQPDPQNLFKVFQYVKEVL